MASMYKRRSVLGGVALAIAVLFANPASSEPEDPVALITQWEHDAASADLSGDASFFQRNLADDWTDGTSDGKFQTKKELISDVTGNPHAVLGETLSDIKVRVYGNTAIATYTETDEWMTKDGRRAKTMITTDTFVRMGGQWKEVAEHSSAVHQ